MIFSVVVSCLSLILERLFITYEKDHVLLLQHLHVVFIHVKNHSPNVVDVFRVNCGILGDRMVITK